PPRRVDRIPGDAHLRRGPAGRSLPHRIEPLSGEAVAGVGSTNLAGRRVAPNCGVVSRLVDNLKSDLRPVRTGARHQSHVCWKHSEHLILPSGNIPSLNITLAPSSIENQGFARAQIQPRKCMAEGPPL